MSKSTKKVLIVLIFLAIIARFIKLEYAPPHLSNDEIGAAYAAYSISKTLKDATGQFLPLLWQSHGGFGSPLAIYIPLASIMAFGNNDIAVRLPSAILGGLTIILIGLTVKELTKNTKLALLTSAMLAISKWHFSAYRWALEDSYALFRGIFLLLAGHSSLIMLCFLSFWEYIYSLGA
jgi:4-amino-4-deoxy-L-arabinose transferase-like glycosyltransferase